VLNWLENYFRRSPHGFRILLVLLRGWKIRGGRILVVFHNKVPHGSVTRLSLPKPLVSYYHLADGIITHSGAGVKILESSGVHQSKIRFVHHGRYPFWPQLLPREPGPIRFVIFGSLAPHKQVHLLLKAFGGVQGTYQLDVIGQCGDQVYATYLAGLMEDAKARWFNYYLPDSEASFRLAEYDYLVLGNNGPSILTSGTLIYSLSMGLPVIGPAVREFSDYILPAYYVGYENLEGLTDTLSELVQTGPVESSILARKLAFNNSLQWRWENVAEALLSKW
jgi:glycosyltransferase involved in cell wall biosynthesis